MIQRIQTLYLLIAAILTAVMLFATLGWFAGQGTESRITAFAPGGPIQNLIGALAAVAAAWSLATIFFFRRRRVQMRLCVVGIILLLAVQAAVIYLFMRIGSAGFVAKYAVVDVFPLIGVVLTYLARRAVKRDEELVRSLDRIR